jgi:membrane protease YdiL (CAAX protease family)
MEQIESTDRQPLWRRVADFPLVAMVIAILLYIMATAAALWVGKLIPDAGRVPNAAVHAGIAIAIMFAVYKSVMRTLGERPHDDLPAENALKYSGLGLLAGFLLFSAVVAVAAFVNVYRIIGYGGTSDLIFSLITIAILPGFMEELLFRGILFRWLEEFAGSWVALILTSGLFGLAHILNPNATWFSSFAIAVEAGVLLGGAYMLTRSLWMPIGIHAAWNYTQGFIFDVPVSGGDQNGLVVAQLSGPEILSGGAFGLEASVIAMVVATAGGLWLVREAVRLGQLVQPWWVVRRRARQAAAQV